MQASPLAVGASPQAVVAAGQRLLALLAALSRRRYRPSSASAGDPDGVAARGLGPGDHLGCNSIDIFIGPEPGPSHVWSCETYLNYVVV